MAAAMATGRPNAGTRRVAADLRLALALAVAPLATALADDWPQWRGPDRNGVSRETGWLDQWPPTELWRSTAVGEGFSGVAVSEGRAYTVGWSSAANQDTVRCFDAETGAQRWSFSYACARVEYPGPRATPTVCGDEVFTLSQQGGLYCFGKTNGQMRWSVNVSAGRPNWGYAGSPLIEGDAVILNAGGAGVAVNRHAPHSVLWTSAGTSGYSSPFTFVRNGAKVTALFALSGLVGVDPASGAVRWSYAWASRYDVAAPDPILYGDKVFISSGYPEGGCALIPLGSGALTAEWTSTSLKIRTGSGVLLGDYLYGVGDDGFLRCLDLRDRSVKWSQSGFGESGSLISADGKLIIQGMGRNLDVARAWPTNYDREGRAAYTLPAGEWRTPPALANGRLYCRSRAGTVVCLRVGTPDRADFDHDGMADQWERDRLPDAQNSLPDDDADRDGRTNGEEYIAGTDPTNAHSRFAVTLTESNGDVRVEWPSPLTDRTAYGTWTRRYRLQSATHAAGPWCTVPGFTNSPASGANLRYTARGGEPAGFFRAGVWLE
jgi:outer membrane protein assembly factor BamB